MIKPRIVKLGSEDDIQNTKWYYIETFHEKLELVLTQSGNLTDKIYSIAIQGAVSMLIQSFSFVQVVL